MNLMDGVQLRQGYRKDEKLKTLVMILPLLIKYCRTELCIQSLFIIALFKTYSLLFYLF